MGPNRFKLAQANAEKKAREDAIKAQEQKQIATFYNIAYESQITIQNIVLLIILGA